MKTNSVILPGGVATQFSRVAVNWETLPPHPVVMADSRGTHTHIKTMGVSDNILLIGYGDWTINLGPVKVIGYDLSSVQPVTLMTQPPELGNEAWERINIIDGKAYLPHTDPTLNNQGAYTTNERGFWETVKVGTNPSLIHAFDIIKFKGRMICCGSMSAGGGAGAVYTETASGSRTFTRTLLGVSRADFARFYKFYLLDNGNEVRVQNSAGGLETFSSTDGLAWTSMPNEPAYAGNDSNGAWNAADQIELPHGYKESSGVIPVLASYQHGGWVYVSGTNGVIKRALIPNILRPPAPGATPAVNLAPNPILLNNNTYWGSSQGNLQAVRSQEFSWRGGWSLKESWSDAPSSGIQVRTHVLVEDRIAAGGTFHASIRLKARPDNVSTFSPTWSVSYRDEVALTNYEFSYAVTAKELPDGWVELSVTHTVPEPYTFGSIYWRNYPTGWQDSQNDSWYWSGFQVNMESDADYFDGDTPDDLAYTYEWSGTPHASTSLRKVRGA